MGYWFDTELEISQPKFAYNDPCQVDYAACRTGIGIKTHCVSNPLHLINSTRIWPKIL